MTFLQMVDAVVARDSRFTCRNDVAEFFSQLNVFLFYGWTPS